MMIYPFFLVLENRGRDFGRCLRYNLFFQFACVVFGWWFLWLYVMLRIRHVCNQRLCYDDDFPFSLL